MSAYVGQTVYFGIRYTGMDAWYIWVDDVTLPDGSYEGFEGGIFPPRQVILIPEYDETTTVDIVAGETIEAVFPSWTPLGIGKYLVTACPQLATDGNPANDCKTEMITLE
jgi:hypothetical protein